MMNKSGLNTLLCISIVKDDKITQCACCASCLIKSLSITGYLRCDNVELKVKLVFYNLAIPSGLNALEVSCYIVKINCVV